MPPDRPSIPALDGLRGLAALLVAAYHAWLLSGQARLDDGPFRDALSSGHFAVSIFFVLSGFVLFWPAALTGGDIGSLRGYARRRIARVVPAFYVVLALGAALFGLLIAAPVTLGDRVSPESLVAHLLLVHNEARLLPGYDGALGLGVNPATWTLSVEWWFYLTLPLVAAAFARRPLVWLAAAAAVAVAGRLALAHGDLGLSARTTALLLSAAPLHAVDFAAGMTGAWLVARHREAVGGVPRAALVAGAGAAVLVALMVLAGAPDGGDARDAARDSAVLAIVLPATVGTVVVALALAPPGILASRPAVWLGKVSYGVFLGHFLLIGLARTTLDLPIDGTLRAFVLFEAFVLTGAVAYGWLSWTLVEAPARRWARRGVSSSRTPRSSASGPPAPSADRVPG